MLRGELAIVGPRPTIQAQVDQYTDRQRRRLEVKPGITGWAQVNGRASLPWHERIELDIWYVDRDRGGWGPPRRLPAPVNSPQSELLPRVDDAGRLFFGSSRPGGHGGGDIYMAVEQGGHWQVSNVGPPVSTAAFEYEAEISRDGRTMIVVADRGDRSHLYRFEHDGTAWVERGRIAARDDVFQVGSNREPWAWNLIYEVDELDVAAAMVQAVREVVDGVRLDTYVELELRIGRPFFAREE